MQKVGKSKTFIFCEEYSHSSDCPHNVDKLSKTGSSGSILAVATWVSAQGVKPIWGAEEKFRLSFLHRSWAAAGTTAEPAVVSSKCAPMGVHGRARVTPTCDSHPLCVLKCHPSMSYAE